jgi:hypothetical protein
MNKIIYSTPEGGVAVIIPAESVELALKDVPEGVAYEIVTTDEIPTDRFFRNAWKANGAAVEVDLDRARAIGHDIRRAKRAEEFAPLDIEATIPARAKQAEAARQVIRDRYAEVQDAIDAAEDPFEIKVALGLEELAPEPAPEPEPEPED